MQDYSFQETLDLLDRVETAENIDAFRYDGIDLWPLFRMLLLFRRSEVKEEAGDPNSVHATTRWKLKLKKWLEPLRVETPNPTDAPRDKVWALYDETYYEDLPGRTRYHKFLDPIVEKDPKRFLRVSTEGKSEPADAIGTPKWEIVQKAHMDYFWTVERQRISADIALRLKGVFTDEVMDVVPFHRFLRSASLVVYYTDIFRKLIRKYKPEAVLLVCYYDERKFGLIHAAREQGVPIVDIQHGSQGQNHIMYHHWNASAERQITTLPSVFWCWNEYWAGRLKNSLNDLKIPFVVETTGHFWFDKLAATDIPRLHSTALSIPDDRPIALFAVQPANFDDTISFLRGVMDADPQWFWMVRLHPRMGGETRRILEALEGYEDRYDLLDSTRMPLIHAFESADVVVSFWSTVLIDGLYRGVPGIVAHPNGKLTFPDLIAEGYLTYVSSPADFVKVVEKIKDGEVSVPEGFVGPSVQPITWVDELSSSKNPGI